MKLNDIFRRKNGRAYAITRAYLRGAYDRAEGKPYINPFPPGGELAQYWYGYVAEQNGEHDEIDLPYEDRHK